MKFLNKYIPYFYFVIAFLILINSIQKYLEDLDQYNIIFSWNTESKFIYLGMRVLLLALVVLAGVQRLKRSRQAED